MKQILFLVFFIVQILPASAQPPVLEKKYPSLLWEITGNGTRKPSYLIGTMHVSSKLAFNLPDSFYIAIRSANVVALETNPETWQEDMSKYDLDGSNYNYMSDRYASMPADYLSINTLRFYKYGTKVERALYSNPSTINNLLYRTYGNESSDFEEDTYLDMYIYQCGKKWGKRVAGVEDYGESMKLMAEAYRDAASDKNRKQRSYGASDEEYSLEKLQEAYRMGNLDLLDSINKYNSVSEAFDEKFLYERNRIQAVSIDSIIRSGSTLFVGVGAAHLPGDRGVIEMLRSRGYKLRPVRMGERASRQKEIVDKIRVPVTFRTETAEDGLYKVDIPGKFFKFGDDPSLDQKQYADMANGSYYMVTRIMTNAWMWNHSIDQVYKTVDSLLYENVPGKIISRTPVTRNGYKGFDIINRTRRGDIQRYNIFITPFEVLFFKMSGNGDYVKNGEEANRFFAGIRLKEYTPGLDVVSNNWKKYTPSYGGFTVDLPHDPYTGNDGSRIFDAEDKAGGIQFRVIRSDINNFRFAEEDTFDLGLMEESFSASEFIDAPLGRKHVTHQGYPALESKYRDKNGSFYLTRFIIQGPHYYTLIAHGKNEAPVMRRFIDSFRITPFVYGKPKTDTDTTLYYTVTTPVYPSEKKIRLDIPQYDYYGLEENEQLSEEELLEAGAFRNKVVTADSTGEQIYISFFRTPRYYFTGDSSLLERKLVTFMGDTSWIVRKKSHNILPNDMRVWESVLSDTGSSRTIWRKTFYKDGVNFTLITQSDTLSGPSTFLKTFYETFTPADTVKGSNPLAKKSALFFADFWSRDSILHNRAVKQIGTIDLDSADLPQLKAVVAGLNWKEKKYLDTKEALINKLGTIPTRSASDYLKQIYYALDDTIQLQYPVLENLLKQKTTYSYGVFRDIITTEPPVLDLTVPGYDVGDRDLVTVYNPGYSYRDGKFMDELFDSLFLTKTILPDLLPLLNLDDYKLAIMNLLGQMVDSQLVKPTDYESYFSKFLIEAKQASKKQVISEKKKAIAKAEENKLDKPTYPYVIPEVPDQGNESLSLYAVLLEPFWEKNAAVPPLIRMMLLSGDTRLKYQTMLLLLRNKRSFPDTLLNYFGSLETYRFELFTDLKRLGQENRFPSRYDNHIDLAMASLRERNTYDPPDSIRYIDRLKTTYRSKEGFVYFFRYKDKKDDLSWKLATVGLVPLLPDQFMFVDSTSPGTPKDKIYSLFDSGQQSRFDLTGFSETKISGEESIEVQLQKELRKMLNSRRKSGKSFYHEETSRLVSSSYSD